MQNMEDKIEEVLNQTKKLSDGSRGKIYSRNSHNNDGKFTYNCHLCSVANLQGEIALFQHAKEEKHSVKMNTDYVPNALRFNMPIISYPDGKHDLDGGDLLKCDKPSIGVVGEFSNYENSGANAPSSNQCYLDSFMAKTQKPLIGVEYVLELNDSRLKEPIYVCVLCDKRCDPRNIISQMTSHRHRMKYLDLHFPKLMIGLNKDRQFNVEKSYCEEVLTNISKYIEDKFGRGKPTVRDYQEYLTNKSQMTESVKNVKLKDSDVFENLLLKNLNIHVNSREASSEDSDDDGTYEKYCERKKNVNSTFGHNSRSTASNANLLRVSQPRSFERWLSPQSERKFKDDYKHEKLIAQLEKETKAIEARHKAFERDPESHPSYTQEWEVYWNEHYKEKWERGINPYDYNYDHEWMPFWFQRMVELKGEEIEAKMTEICKKLDTTPEAARRYINKRAKHPRTRSPSYSPSPDRSRKHQNSRLDADDEDSDSSDFSVSNKSQSSVSSESSEVTDDTPINFVAVCRLLVAQKYELGDLAPIALKLLEEALMLEKNEAKSSDKLLLVASNLKYLNDAKEKLHKSQPRKATEIMTKRCIRVVEKFLEGTINDNNIRVDNIVLPLLRHTAWNKFAILARYTKNLLKTYEDAKSYEEKLQLIHDNMIFIEIISANKGSVFSRIQSIVSAWTGRFNTSNNNNNDYRVYEPNEHRNSLLNSILQQFFKLKFFDKTCDELVFGAIELANLLNNRCTGMMEVPSNIAVFREIKKKLQSEVEMLLFNENNDLMEGLIMDITQLLE